MILIIHCQPSLQESSIEKLGFNQDDKVPLEISAILCEMSPSLLEENFKLIEQLLVFSNNFISSNTVVPLPVQY